MPLREQQKMLQVAAELGTGDEDPLLQQWNLQTLEAAIEVPFYRWRRWRGVGNILFLLGVFLVSACVIHPGLQTIWIGEPPISILGGVVLSGVGVATVLGLRGPDSEEAMALERFRGAPAGEAPIHGQAFLAMEATLQSEATVHEVGNLFLDAADGAFAGILRAGERFDAPARNCHSGLIDLSRLRANGDRVWIEIRYDPVSSYVERLRDILSLMSAKGLPTLRPDDRREPAIET